jgi:hypothetical protein
LLLYGNDHLLLPEASPLALDFPLCVLKALPEGVAGLVRWCHLDTLQTETLHTKAMVNPACDIHWHVAEGNKDEDLLEGGDMHARMYARGVGDCGETGGLDGALMLGRGFEECGYWSTRSRVRWRTIHDQFVDLLSSVGYQV